MLEAERRCRNRWDLWTRNRAAQLHVFWSRCLMDAALGKESQTD